MKRGNLSRINGFVTSLILIVQSFPVVLSCDKHYALDPDGKPIVCTSPFASPSSKKRRILSTQINDGYCDCPTDGGYDELLTGACSGSTSGGWAGIPPENPEMDKVFICPQQLDLQIPLSRVRDGICDCCDGSDESSDHVKESHCHDVCDELFKGQREERAKIRETYNIGSEKRKTSVEEYWTVIGDTKEEKQKLHKKIKMVNIEIRSLNKHIEEEMMTVIESWFKAVETSIQKSDNLIPGTMDDLETLIASSCHIQGELMEVDDEISKWNNGNTCIGLRLAAMGMGIMWEKNTVLGIKEEEKLETSTKIASIMIGNAGKTKDFSIGSDDDSKDTEKSNSSTENVVVDHKTVGKSILDSLDFCKYGGCDDYKKDIDVPHQPYADLHDVDHKVVDVEIANNKEFLENFQSMPSPISVLRIPFRHQASKITALINVSTDSTDINDEVIDDGDDDEDDEDDDDMVDESDNNDKDEQSASSNDENEDDPMMFQMVNTRLLNSLKALKRGEEFATSARILLGSLKDATGNDVASYKQILFGLAVQTLYQTKISGTDFVEIVQLYNVESKLEQIDKFVCMSPYSTMCPIQTQKMETIHETNVDFPQSNMLTQVNEICEERGYNFLRDNLDICTSSTDVELTVDEIPDNVPDGYFGFYEAKRRISEDSLSYHFKELDDHDLTSLRLTQLQTAHEIKTLVHKKKSEKVEQLVNRLTESKDSKYGDEELYVIGDSCFDITHNKYVYELCMFGKAHQRDVGTESGGTDLGKFEEMSKDDESGLRTLKWTNGAKCWNGPKRSATVLISCGIETKLISADEPNICEYVLKMESHVACDQVFAKQHNLF